MGPNWSWGWWGEAFWEASYRGHISNLFPADCDKQKPAAFSPASETAPNFNHHSRVSPSWLRSFLDPQAKNKQLYCSKRLCFLVAHLKHIWIPGQYIPYLDAGQTLPSGRVSPLLPITDESVGKAMPFHSKKPDIVFRRNQQICPKFKQWLLKHLGRKKIPKAVCRWIWHPKMSWIVLDLWIMGELCLAKLLRSSRSIIYILLICYPGLPFDTRSGDYVSPGRMQKQEEKKKTSRYLCLAWIYEEGRKCLFNVYESSPWPHEATAVLVHKQHD